MFREFVKKIKIILIDQIALLFPTVTDKTDTFSAYKNLLLNIIKTVDELIMILLVLHDDVCLLLPKQKLHGLSILMTQSLAL